MEEEHNSWIGRTLSGRYQILEVIGQGGMGVIFRARQLSIDRIVAIKMMHARASQSQDNIDRFHREAKACSRLTHPNTVRLYDFGQTTLGNLYMVMELLEGRSLRQVIADEAPISAPRVLRILMQCCASLAEAHAANIIHRDIKPENIVLQNLAGASDFVKLFDFSIAKIPNAQMTAVGTIFGTPQYMSPEQSQGRPVDGRSDIYSLGIVAYAMLSNTLPFHHQDPLTVLKMHREMPVPPLPPEVPDMVAKVVMGCLQKRPEQRPASAMALLEACKVWLTTLDPSLDLASDPVLKNTLISSGPPPDMEDEDPHSKVTLAVDLMGSQVKTMLSASGRQRRISETDGGGASVPAQDPPTMNSIMKTLVHAPAAVLPRTAVQKAQPGPPAAAPSAPAPSAPAPRPPVAAEPRPEGHTDSSAAVTTINSRSMPAPPPPLALPAQKPQAPSGPSAPGIQPPGPGPVPAPVIVSESLAPAAMMPAQAAMVPPQAVNPMAQTTPLTPRPLPQQSSSAVFAITCLLVALTFGFGGYYITAALR